MSNNIKSLLLLALTLVVGFALGLFADATLVRARRDRIAGMRRPPGLMARLEEVIQPHSAAQADSIRPVLQALAAGNEQVMRDANVHLRARVDSARAALAPMLDAAQRDRLQRELDRLPPMGRGGPMGGGRGRGGRGDDRGGPPGPPADDRPPPP